MRFNPPPGWPVPPGWLPGPGRSVDPSWPAPPPGWEFWVVDEPSVAPRIVSPVVERIVAPPVAERGGVQPVWSSAPDGGPGLGGGWLSRPVLIAVVVVVVAVLVVGVGVLVLDGGGSSRTSAGSLNPVTPVVITVPTVVILDASGSMTVADAPGPRIDAAKKAAQGLVDALPDDATIGLTTYGTGTGSTEAEQAAGCQDVTTLIGLGRLDRGAMGQRIAGLVASGYTPMSLALQRAADQLPADGSGQAIVLVSDGEDTCGAPPCDTAAALKRSHPGLTISTVGFKTDGPASDQLACIAQATGGLFVGAANADQLATRLIAVQNIDAAKKALTADGIDGIGLGQSLDAIRMAHPDFPDGSREGRVVVVYVDCDFGFLDGTLDSIAPHDGGHTIDGVTRGTELSRVSALYGEPVTVDSDKHVVIYRADSGNAESVAGFRIDVERFAQNGSSVTGTVKTIVLCRCKPMAAAASVDPELFWAVSEGSGGYFFTTPSGEWRCAILQWGKTPTAGCQPSTSIDMPVAGAPMVPNHYDGSPAMPNAIVIDAGQPARFAALGQAVYWRFGGPARVLEYGETLSVMGFTCNVQESGVSCREDATGNGFSFSADGYKFEYTPVLQTTTAAPQVVLGSSMGGSSVGYGTERPATISLGSCANAISSITWDSWGEPVAHGDGTACAQTGTPAHYALVASDLGLCQGVLAYRTFQIGPNDPQSICE